MAMEYPTTFEVKKTLIINNLSANVREETVRKLLELYGTVTFMAIIPPLLGRNSSQVIVVYSEISSANAAKCALRFHGMNGKTLDICLLWLRSYGDIKDYAIPDFSLDYTAAQSEKRVVSIKNVFIGLHFGIMHTELSKFGVIQNMTLLPEGNAFSLEIKYASPLSAAAAASLVTLIKENMREKMETSLFLGKVNGIQLREANRIEPIASDSLNSIEEAEMENLYKKLAFDVSLIPLINREIVQNHVHILPWEKRSPQTKIVPLCQWTKDNAAVVQVLTTSNNVAAVLIEIDYNIRDYQNDCETCSQDPNLDCCYLKPALSNWVTVPSWKTQVSYLLELKVKDMEAYTKDSRRVDETGLLERKPLNNKSDSQIEKEKTRPSGCVMVRLHMKPESYEDAKRGQPDFTLHCRNLNYLCPKIIGARDLLASPDNSIPNTIVVESRVTPVNFRRKAYLRTRYKGRSYNPNLPNVSSLPDVTIMCTSSRGEKFEFPIVYYQSLHLFGV